MSEKRYSMPIIQVALLMALQLCLPVVLHAAATSVTKTEDLDFGKLVGGAGLSGTVTISTSGGRSASGTVIPLGTVFSPARFTITGNAGKGYTVTLPAAGTMTSGTAQMTISAITASIPTTGVIPAGGSLPFVVGATLTVNSAQQNSTYSGSLAITVR